MLSCVDAVKRKKSRTRIGVLEGHACVSFGFTFLTGSRQEFNAWMETSCSGENVPRIVKHME